jgi:hypothetical protein
LEVIMMMVVKEEIRKVKKQNIEFPPWEVIDY